MQISAGTVAVINGDATIVGTGVDWTDAREGCWFIVEGRVAVYQLAADAVMTDPGVGPATEQWTVELTAPWAQDTESDLAYIIHATFGPLEEAIFDVQDTALKQLLNRNAMIYAQRFLTGGTVGSASIPMVKTISGGDIGLEAVAMEFGLTLDALPAFIGLPVIEKADPADDNVFAVSIDSVTTTGYNVNLSAPAIAGQKIRNTYIP